MSSVGGMFGWIDTVPPATQQERAFYLSDLQQRRRATRENLLAGSPQGQPVSASGGGSSSGGGGVSCQAVHTSTFRQQGYRHLPASPIELQGLASLYPTVAFSHVVASPGTGGDQGGVLRSDHVGARWEGLPLTSSALLETEDGATTVITDTIKDEDDETEPKTCPQKTLKFCKLMIPHVILISVLLAYLCFGAYILILLETGQELIDRSRTLVTLSKLFNNLTLQSWKELSAKQDSSGRLQLSEEEWTLQFQDYLVQVAEVMDGRRPIRTELERPGDVSNIVSRWTFPTALLYVLTVLTTCGYGEVSVNTDIGKIFSVAFALVGIPLMFITAADIGKFLSETLLKFVDNWNMMVHNIKQVICSRRNIRKRSMHPVDDPLEILGLGETTEDKLWFPIGAYVSCICLYCSMGAAMFIHYNNEWSFIHSFHFGFNLIVTVGLGELVVTDYLFLALIVAFVIIGLSVVTMCVDLASTHLKAYFTRIHYFGRAKRFLGISDELRDIVGLLAAMRKKKGGKVTWNDVRDFLSNELKDRPFEPHELLLKMRFIDETSSSVSTIRHNSCSSDLTKDPEHFRDHKHSKYANINNNQLHQQGNGANRDKLMVGGPNPPSIVRTTDDPNGNGLQQDMAYL